MAEARPLPAHVIVEVQRIADAVARRILDEQLAAEKADRPTP